MYKIKEQQIKLLSKRLPHSVVKQVESIMNEYERKITEKLFDAVVKGDLKNVKNLVNRGANVNSTDYVGFTPIMTAVRYNHLELVKYFYNEIKVDVNLKENVVKNNLLHIAARQGNLEIFKFLVENAKMNIHTTNADGITPKYMVENSTPINSELLSYIKGKEFV